MSMNIPGRMVVLLLCLVLVIVALTGCLGGGDDGGDQGDGGNGDTGDNAADFIVSEDDLPAGWYSFNWTQIYGVDYPAWQGDFGSFAIAYFSDSEDVWNSTEFLIIGVLDFDETTSADYWYDTMKDQYDISSTTQPLWVGDEGFYIDENGDGTDMIMYFRNGDVCVFIDYYADDTPLSLSQVIDLAEIQNDKL